MAKTIRRVRIGGCLALALLLGACGISKSLRDRPDLHPYNSQIPERIQESDSSFTLGANSLAKNKQGQWELYVSGDPLEVGLITGALTQELYQQQEAIFLSKVTQLVPSKVKRSLLRKFLAWYNRKMHLHIPEEYKAEIYGLSQFAPDTYNTLAEPYLRTLYLHGAHDIGHALQDLALVGCSSFAVWGEGSADGELLIGRNFDFYVGDDFARNQIISFVDPTHGHKFMSVTWGGMLGVVSGMNEHGLTVTINAGKSKIPLVAKTPISLVAREILQYARNLEEAVAIAKRRQVFVSESIMVGSATDQRAITIEVSPKNFGVYEVSNTHQLICANHFQSEAYANDQHNLAHQLESHSQYRYQQMEGLLETQDKITPENAVGILRNKEGHNGKDIGYGNEKALNQLLAHHGIVFQPEQRRVWVSSNPYQLGEFVAYDLKKIFSDSTRTQPIKGLSDAARNIPKDPFLDTQAYRDYERYREMTAVLQAAIAQKKSVSPAFIEEYKMRNPEYWETYYWLGRYYYGKKYNLAAYREFVKAGEKEIPTVPQQERVARYIKKLTPKGRP